MGCACVRDRGLGPVATLVCVVVSPRNPPGGQSCNTGARETKNTRGVSETQTEREREYRGKERRVLCLDLSVSLIWCLRAHCLAESLCCHLSSWVSLCLSHVSVSHRVSVLVRWLGLRGIHVTPRERCLRKSETFRDRHTRERNDRECTRARSASPSTSAASPARSSPAHPPPRPNPRPAPPLLQPMPIKVAGAFPRSNALSRRSRRAGRRRVIKPKVAKALIKRGSGGGRGRRCITEAAKVA